MNHAQAGLSHRALSVVGCAAAVAALFGLGGCLRGADGSTGQAAPPDPAVRVSGGLYPQGWSSAGLRGPAFSEESCHVRWAKFQGLEQPLPDPSCTPGAIDPDVTQSDIHQTICRPGGFTSSVRPPEGITEPVKYQAMKAYGFYDGRSAKAYEFDHLIPLELGGSSSTYNLWPEADVGLTSRYINNTKDQVEDDLHAAVCAGRITLREAQDAIATDWVSAEAALGVRFASG